MTEPTPVAKELAAMRRIVSALDGLDERAQDRIAGWLFDRYRRPEALLDHDDPRAVPHAD